MDLQLSVPSFNNRLIIRSNSRTLKLESSKGNFSDLHIHSLGLKGKDNYEIAIEEGSFVGTREEYAQHVASNNLSWQLAQW